jgi:hypothetical protein
VVEIGSEDEPERSAEICIGELFGRDLAAGRAGVGMGLHPFGTRGSAPMQFMLGIYEFPDDDYLRGYRPQERQRGHTGRRTYGRVLRRGQNGMTMNGEL